MYKLMCIGIDQSYACTGISVAVDKQLKIITSINFSGCETKPEKREYLKYQLNAIVNKYGNQAEKIIIICERVRLFSHGVINMDAMLSMSGLIITIADFGHENNIPVYSVGTSNWKKRVIGTNKKGDNKYNYPPEKWPTIKWLINQGYGDKIKMPVSAKKKNGVFVDSSGWRYTYDDNAADSAGICLSAWAKGINLNNELT